MPPPAAGCGCKVHVSQQRRPSPSDPAQRRDAVLGLCNGGPWRLLPACGRTGHFGGEARYVVRRLGEVLLPRDSERAGWGGGHCWLGLAGWVWMGEVGRQGGKDGGSGISHSVTDRQGKQRIMMMMMCVCLTENSRYPRKPHGTWPYGCPSRVDPEYNQPRTCQPWSAHLC